MKEKIKFLLTIVRVRGCNRDYLSSGEIYRRQNGFERARRESSKKYDKRYRDA